MSDQDYPVNVSVTRADGRVELVRVGTARREGDGFTLRLGELAIGATADKPAPARRAAPSSDGGVVFPQYGRSKGQPVAGASMQDLEFYANGCRRSLNDPSKSRWHDKERTLLAALEAEMARQGGGAPPPAPRDDHAPPSRRDDGPPPLDDDAPPPSDDDVPF